MVRPDGAFNPGLGHELAAPRLKATAIGGQRHALSNGIGRQSVIPA
jgi:hypothetical protein